MILYDQNYNFLGISSETVNFLGYEDIQEFLSMNSDFANLLVQNEGKIYKFKNFSWIDFILYSGAPNKLATVKLKDDSEIDIKLTVKEITFAKELGGFEKCYAVRIISDKFVNIASKVNENMKFEVNSNVSLSNLLTEEQPALKEETKTEKVVESIEEEIALSFKKPKIEDEINIPTFDFPPAEELKKEISEDVILEKSEVIPIEDEKMGFDFLTSDELDTNVSESIKLDLTSDESLQEVLVPEEIEQNDFILKDRKDSELVSKQTEVIPEKKSEPSAFNLSFLKKVDEQDEELVVQQTIVPQQETIQQETVQQETVQQETVQQETVQQETNLNFLKKYKNSDEVDTQQENKQEIIEQIKSDIDEIDEQSNDSIPTINSGSFVRNVFSETITQEKETTTDTFEFENPELIADFINESKINIMQLKSFLSENNYKNALYPVAKMNASADILNLNDIISSLSSIKSSVQLEEKETILNNIDLLEDKLNILNSKIKQEAAFS